MKILQILPELNVGGVETGTVDVAKYLIRKGHEAVVISAGGDLVKELESLGAKHYALPVHKKSFFNIRSLIPQVAKIIRDEKIDVVHARSRVPAWVGFFAARRAQTPFITTSHGYYSKHFFSRAMGWGKFVICPSDVIAHHMMDNFGVPHERIRLIPRGVDTQRFEFTSPESKPSEVFNVGIVGRITPIKGHVYFLKAMAKVVRACNRPKIKIWIVGDAPQSHLEYKEEIRVLVKRLGLELCTEFLGTQKDIPTIMSHLNLLVMPSVTHEAFGRVLIEAGASGVPVIGTYVGGIREIISHEITGLLAAPGDVDSLAEGIVRIIKDPELAKRLAMNAQKRVAEEFNAELMVSRTIEVYKEAVTKRKILLVKLSSLGDAILATAAVRAIREKFPSPDTTFKILVSESTKDVFLHCPYIDGCLMYDYKGRAKGMRAMSNKARELRKENFDISIDLQNNRLSHVLMRYAMIPERYGYRNKKLGFLVNHGVKNAAEVLDPVAHQFKVLATLGITLTNPYLELWPNEQDEAYIEEFLEKEWLRKEEVLIGINLAASTRWQTKAWPAEHIQKLCAELGKRSYRVILTGTSDDLARAGEISQSVRGAKPIIACGKTTLNQLACLIKRCSIFISSDSAPLHVACAVQTPCIALFGPTDPKRHVAPLKKGIILRKDLDCSPCYRSKCKTVACMQQITPEEVLVKIEELLRV